MILKPRSFRGLPPLNHLAALEAKAPRPIAQEARPVIPLGRFAPTASTATVHGDTWTWYMNHRIRYTMSYGAYTMFHGPCTMSMGLEVLSP